MDSVSCVPLTAALLAALLSATRLTGSQGILLAVSSVSVTVVALLSRRWWLTPAALIVLTVIWLPVSLLTGGLADSVDYLRGFADWIAYGAPRTNTAGYALMLYLIAGCAVAAPLFAILRRFFFFPVFVALQISAAVLSIVFTDADPSAAVCLGAAGLVLLLPRVFARHIEKLGVPGSGASKSTGLSRARMQAVAIPAAVLAVLFALLITPADTWTWRSYLLNTWIEDFNELFSGRYRGSPLAGYFFDLADTGYQTQTGRLGGPVTLGDELYLTVNSPRPVLLKGSVLDYYDGAAWRASRPDGDMRFNSLLWRGRRSEAFDLDKPVGNYSARQLFSQLTEEIKVVVQHEDKSFISLFTAGSLMSVSPSARLKEVNVYFNMRSGVYMRMYIPRKAGYTLRTRVWNTRLTDFDVLFTQLEESVRDEKRYGEIAERYTQLPGDLPDNVRDTAALITEGIGSPYMKAAAISRWLAENAEYTLEPDIPPEGVDFTAHFLESHEGYCVYYATAMTVLARCAGLPARYVQGFALLDNSSYEGDYPYRATGKSAHAWSEVYFEGIGWVPFDPLSWDSDAPLNEASEADAPHIPVPTTPVFPTPPEDTADQQPARDTRDGKLDSGLLVFLLSGLFIISAGGLYRFALYAGPRRMARLWTSEAVRRRFPDPSKRLDALYADTLRLLALHGASVLPGETLVTFPERADRIAATKGLTLAEFAEVMMDSHFGGITPSEEQIERACMYHGALETKTLELLGKRGYLFRRVLTLQRSF